MVLLIDGADIGYFYPDMAISCGTGDETEKVKSIAEVSTGLPTDLRSRNVNFVKNLSQNMETCFPGEALYWWNNGIDPITRRVLIYANSMD
jgi:hypothetical protein